MVLVLACNGKNMFCAPVSSRKSMAMGALQFSARVRKFKIDILWLNKISSSTSCMFCSKLTLGSLQVTA
jgi:hypothetical protein